MPAIRHNATRSFFLSLCLTLPGIPALPQSPQTDIDATPQTAPQTDPDAVQNGAQSTEITPPDSSPLWTTPADLVERQSSPAPARSTGTDILSCPFEALRAAYLSLYEETDALNVAALESEVYKICIERQKLIELLLDKEERLRAQLGDLAKPVIIARTRPIAPAVAAEIAEQEDVAGADATVALPVGPTVPAPGPPETFREAKAAELARSAHGQCSDRYTSGAIFGAATLKGGLHAFVFDSANGTERTVKVGDTLPGGLTITSISTENGVIISEAGETRPLAQALTAPAFDDGGGLLFETVGLADVYKPDDSQNGDWETIE